MPGNNRGLARASVNENHLDTYTRNKRNSGANLNGSGTGGYSNGTNNTTGTQIGTAVLVNGVVTVGGVVGSTIVITANSNILCFVVQLNSPAGSTPIAQKSNYVQGVAGIASFKIESNPSDNSTVCYIIYN